MKVKIISDSTCDLSPELIERYDIAITPLSVHCGDQVGHDGVEITPETIYDYVDASGQLPRTSAVNVFDYVREFRSWHQQGYSVVHFCISSDFSSSYQNACMAAADVGDVYVVDSRNLSTGQGLLVLHGAELAAAGHTAEEIQRACTDLAPRVEASFVIDRLDYLYKGGRCSALSAFGGNLLKLKPCIEVKDGKMTPGKKYRGPIDKVMLQYTQDRLQGRDDINRHRVFITHTRCAPEAVEAVRIVGEALGVSLASMCACLNPEVVCIGGSVSELGDMLLKPTRMAFRRSAFATLKETPIEKALLRGNAGLVGAALLALDKC